MDLSKAIKNTKYKVSEISSQEIESRLLNFGIYPGAEVTLKRKAPIFGNPMLFEIDDRQIALTKEEAKLIFVEAQNE